VRAAEKPQARARQPGDGHARHNTRLQFRVRIGVQLAKRMKARVLAVASGHDGVEFVKRLGADKVIDGHREDILKVAHEFAPNGLDAAFLTAGGKPPRRRLRRFGKAAGSLIRTAWMTFLRRVTA
jgi:D-arabinose 1-dehydrogenase-like Zn-dependent alcohol dehydrogenase